MNNLILLVEDNASDEKLTLLAFRGWGVPHQITVVRDGAAAIDYLVPDAGKSGRESAPLPRIVLLDLKLPKVDGLEVLRRVRADDRTRLLPVIVLTASKEDEDLVRSYSLGANAYVRKPVDFGEFAKAAQTLGQFWLVMNQPAPRGGAAP